MKNLHPISGGSAELEALAESVHATVGVIESTLVFIAGLQEKLAAVAGDAEATLALKDELEAEKSKLAAAIAANA